MSNRRGGPPPIVYILGFVAVSFGVWSLKDKLFSGVPQPLSIFKNSDELVILGDTFSGYSVFRAPEFQDELEQAGLSLRYDNEFDQAKRAASLQKGDADLIVTTLDQYLKHQPAGKIIGLVDRTVGADAVVLNTPKYPRLKSLNDLSQLVAQGQSLSLAYAADTPSEFLAQVLDIRFDGFNLSDFEQLKVAEASEAWQAIQDPNQTIAVAVLWEPFVSQARGQGYTVVLSSKDAPNAILDVIVASDQAIAKQEEQLTELLSTYYRRMDQSARDDTQLKTVIQTDGNLSVAQTNAVIEGIDFFTAVEAGRWMEDGTLAKRIDATAAILVLSGQLPQVPAANELYNNQFIAEAVANTQSLIQLVQTDDPELAKFLAGEVKPVQAQAALTPAAIQSSQPIGDLEVRGEVTFGTGSAAIATAGQQTLNQLATEINEFNTETIAIRVIGHTSKTGSAAINQTLSQQRAQAVVNYLKSQSVNHNILAEGKGFSEPLTGITANDPRNQRTEIRLVRINQ
ncbi:phosphate ABC transporter substrate-binding/OmpA family protein [Leptothoe sp. PORK10 BA2]|uniref:phosphate ABC transporter substrate-binding/OmpA family protein n=1 Tax=Leptothoe sp. PORK10 BA2 TaxID=3110254 RepID=UPI002B1EE722|nr:phosphate ABC transporter substrate-binding/OmpA family protein [Leptothoe sp. PORK10 BA2]MEA5466058.1 phosphate ABC transporter substrate-binding/OmpA family protein [Leptothoe sp. PORK10 BA2]